MSVRNPKNYEELIIQNLKVLNNILDSDYLGKKGYTYADASTGASTDNYAGFMTLSPTVFTSLTSNIDFNGVTVNTITFPTGIEIPCRISGFEISSGSILLMNP